MFQINQVENMNGITVRELKDFINQFPDTDENGEDSEVWVMNIENDGLSSPAVSMCRLNATDIILSSHV